MAIISEKARDKIGATYVSPYSCPASTTADINRARIAARSSSRFLLNAFVNSGMRLMMTCGSVSLGSANGLSEWQDLRL